MKLLNPFDNGRTRDRSRRRKEADRCPEKASSKVGRAVPSAPTEGQHGRIRTAVGQSPARWGQRALPGCSALTLLLGLLVIAPGCAYTVGPVNGIIAKEKSVQVNAFVNQTVEPNVTDAVTSQLRKCLQQDGTYRLATHGDGDIIISGTITNFQRHELTFARTDTLTVRDYRLALSGRVTAVDRSSGKVILDAPVSGYTMIRVGADLVSTERQALPLLAQDLAKNVTSLLVEGSW